jgi:hypothetical protein
MSQLTLLIVYVVSPAFPETLAKANTIRNIARKFDWLKQNFRVTTDHKNYNLITL